MTEKKESPTEAGNSPMYAFVYGTLKSNHMGVPGKFLGPAIAVGSYEMYSGGFPVVIDSNDGHGVIGEAYEIDEKARHGLDRYEGHPSFYERQLRTVRLEDDSQVMAWIYLGTGVRSSIPHRPRVQPNDAELLAWD